MKLCVFMWYDINSSTYGNYNYIINKVYCDKYNIDLICCNKRRYPDRHQVWERIPILLENITKYDYVMWIDGDAHFYIDSENIIDFINKYSSYDFIFSKDIGVETINAGVFIVKNTQYSIDFLTKWGYDEILYNNNTRPHWREQGVLIDMYSENLLDIRTKSININYGILQHFRTEELPSLVKPFIFHLAGTATNDRVNHSLKYIIDNNIFYKKRQILPIIVRRLKNKKYKMNSLYNDILN